MHGGGGGRQVFLVGRPGVVFRPWGLGRQTRLDGALTKPFSSYRAVPVSQARACPSPIGGGTPLLGSEALSPSVSIGVCGAARRGGKRFAPMRLMNARRASLFLSGGRACVLGLISQVDEQ
jgi:hypothetical protein